MGLDIFVGGKKSDLTKKTGHFRPWIIGDGKIRHWEKYGLDQKNWTYSSSPIVNTDIKKVFLHGIMTE